ncbi:permease-like cell division protein FtsX [Simiduia sp. 21SJ11W-1]|uniref:permease-like cell division protein FtsX n=1 Tax=Simiduia sp. 21SJ11W-1 TaxID=2909669 RepID=UPI0020A0305A|nr:permease-like cell division protein FtsX [Simiduia sp. 21SJ11W-1]UTA48017.1 permease-like cell division protein FtsX [Simiduia sp. 21SJ11W-1]
MNSPRKPISAPRAGARLKKAGVNDRARAWREHHVLSARDSLQKLLVVPVRTLLTVLMLGIALALPALLYVALANVGQLSGQWASNHQMSAYLKPGVRPAAVEALVARWQQLPGVLQVQPVSPEQGLAEFARQTGLAGAVGGMQSNPLPWALLVQPKHTDPKALAALRDALADDVIVDEVRLDLAWLTRLQSLMALGQRFALGLGCLLGLGMLLAIGNTLRLAIENRREEILVVKLVGGTDAFVRRPFLYTGLWYGLGGGLWALLLTQLGLWLVSAPVAALASSYGSAFALQGLAFGESLILLLIALMIGWLGAWLAVDRHLRDIKPQ